MANATKRAISTENGKISDSYVQYPSLPNGVNNAPGSNLRICIVTSHFAGPAKTAGLGTAYMALGEALAADGHDVTVLYLRGERSDQFSIDYWVGHYRTRNITFVPLGTYTEIDSDCPYFLRRPYEAYLWLKQHAFDVIHYSDCYGVGYHIARAKRENKDFAATLLCAGTHGSAMWLETLDALYSETEERRAHFFMERQSIAWADIVVSPSQYMLNWLSTQGVPLPPKSYVQQNILPDISLRTSAKSAEARPVKEIIFFGRMEPRKGLELFCDACDLLTAEEIRDVTVTFLGNSVKTPQGNTSDYVRNRAARWPFAWQILADKGHTEGQHYVQRPGLVAIIPSLGENSPYTVLECLGAGVPFLASHVGGIAELIAAEEIERVCFVPQPSFLAEKIRTALHEGVLPAHPAVDCESNKAAWLAWHRNLQLPNL